MHVVVVGAGIVGLAVAARLTGDGHRVTVLEKEQSVAVHQTGRNSGVIHSGLYYTPGSLKARMSVAGQRSMTAYAREHGVDVEITGKLVVATTPDQVAGLHQLAERARANGVPARLVGRTGAREHEPHVACVDALWVESTGHRRLHRRLPGAGRRRSSAGGGRGPVRDRVVAATETADGVHLGSSARHHDRAARRTPWWPARVCTPTGSRARAGSTRARGSCRSAASTSSSPDRRRAWSTASSTPCPTRGSRSSACT